MTATVRLTWPIKDWPNPNRDRRQHWAVNAKKARAIRTVAASLGTQARLKIGSVMSPVEVTLAWAFPDSRERDLENWSSKALLDGLVDSGLLEGDSARHIVRTVRVEDAERTERGTLRVTVTITPTDRSGG